MGDKPPVISRGPLLNCAGQWCEERMRCRRYRTRTMTNGTLGWASFDVERVRFGDCPSFVAYRG